jgi:opacity protein-like surface antigen
MSKLSKLAAGSVIAATAAFGGASAALADGYSAKPKVAYERPSDWSGVYFGLSSGYQWSSINVGEPGITSHFSGDQNSAIAGGHLGIQHQFGQIVLGVEGSLLFAFQDDRGEGTCPNPTFKCSAYLNDIYTAGGRIGWAAGHWMPYVTGGYASGRFTYQAHTITPPTLTLFETASTRNNGWYIGGGVEWLVSPGWTVGVEYRHYDFDVDTTQAFSPSGSPTFLRTIDPTTDSVTARVSWKWGREAITPLK